jgi:threonine aldolase
MVYISQSTELGTIYCLNELKEISAVCKKHNLIFFIDGARMLTSLFAKVNDCSLADMSALCDVMYIGGTKAGALLGEALVINNDSLKENFRYILKQNGALMSKGFIMGMQFEGLFENGNYKKYCKAAIESADKIRDALKQKGIALEIESHDTQTFAIFKKSQYESLASSFNFGGATIKGDLAYVRICTSWATTKESVAALVSAIKNL